ncbi:MAG: ribosomal-processing cysteine protease Prp [Bacillota bacterium]|jgi:uncharacterized protein YsxB (DUF464 family)|nr:ribosomal-processing cysteine protease Prp [Bacillota bacterium]MDY0118859.1 ribosomal-processing cysteine protease Prp [Bacilli bacterium]HOF65102.1 ribosomal-processing cysteine protease Prp [Bacilli bacterium]
MITVIIEKRGDQIGYVEVKGHANYAPKGQDLVCAAVSAVTIGALNALENHHDFKIVINEGEISLLLVAPKMNAHDEIVINTMLTSLRTIEQTYGSYIKIKER